LREKERGNGLKRESRGTGAVWRGGFEKKSEEKNVGEVVFSRGFKEGGREDSLLGGGSLTQREKRAKADE